MGFTLRQRHLSLLLLVALVGCQPSLSGSSSEDNLPSESASDTSSSGSLSSGSLPNTEPENTESSETAALNDRTSVPKSISPALLPGTYCYLNQKDTSTVDYARLTVNGTDQVTGNAVSQYYNEAEGFHTRVERKVNGTIDGSNLNLDVTSWYEVGRDNKQETWKVSDRELTAGTTTISKANCETVSKLFEYRDGLEAADLTAGANNVKTQTVYFDSGSATLQDSVAGGDRHLYTFTAREGQFANFSLISTQGSATFGIIAPTDRIFGTELTEHRVRLSHTGEYRVVVGDPQGDATYELAIALE